MCGMKPFEILEHTADVAILARGRDLRELIANAAAAMLSILYTGGAPAAQQVLDREIEAEASDLLVHHCLRELLYLLEDEALAPVTVEVAACSETAASLRIGVVDRETALPLLGGPVKAVTRHGLGISIVPSAAGDVLETRIVFDV